MQSDSWCFVCNRELEGVFKQVSLNVSLSLEKDFHS